MNILVLTNIYPAPDLEKGDTPVVHYFTREWVKMGHNVYVLHYPANFPKIYMWTGALFKKRLSSKLGVLIRVTQALMKSYELEGVKVKRIPLMKYKLHGSFPNRQMRMAYHETRRYLDSEGFCPNVIISHWVNPQLEIMERLKRDFQVPTCYVAHTPVQEFNIYENNRARDMISKIDLIGFRSQYIKDVFLQSFGYTGLTFQCYSGIPEEYIPKKNTDRKFDCVTRFIFVGTFIKRKYPAEIIPAVVTAFGEEDFEITYIGEGREKSTILHYAKLLGVSKKVHLLGRVSRNGVMSYLKQSDVFIMNSRSEAFGLVYLEAMAQGCITIASRHEGFDGIIRDGENGFLCNAGDIDDLASTIKKIRSLKAEHLKSISNKAIETARRLTDKNAATMYLQELKKLAK